MAALALFSSTAPKFEVRRLIALLCCLLVVFSAITTLMVTSSVIWPSVTYVNPMCQSVSDHTKAMNMGYHTNYALTCDTQNNQDQMPVLQTIETRKVPLVAAAQYMMLTMNPMVRDKTLYLLKNDIGSSE